MSNAGPKPAPLSPAEFAAETGVSRETLARLEAYAELLGQWSPRINLVASSTLADPWRRHFLDSAQLLPLIAPHARLIDVGSGAGFPGLVLAVMGLQNVRLVESNQAKCAFLRAVAVETGARVEVYAERAEVLAH